MIMLFISQELGMTKSDGYSDQQPDEFDVQYIYGDTGLRMMKRDMEIRRLSPSSG